jgi:hypothetical protein
VCDWINVCRGPASPLRMAKGAHCTGCVNGTSDYVLTHCLTPSGITEISRYRARIAAPRRLGIRGQASKRAMVRSIDIRVSHG